MKVFAILACAAPLILAQELGVRDCEEQIKRNATVIGKNDIRISLYEFVKKVIDQAQVSPHDHHNEQILRDRRKDSPFDWSTDACTASPDKPFGYDFKSSCVKHDFGRRNSRLLREKPNKYDCGKLWAKHYRDMFEWDLVQYCEELKERTNMIRGFFCSYFAAIYSGIGGTFNSKRRRSISEVVTWFNDTLGEALQMPLEKKQESAFHA